MIVSRATWQSEILQRPTQILNFGILVILFTVFHNVTCFCCGRDEFGMGFVVLFSDTMVEQCARDVSKITVVPRWSKLVPRLTACKIPMILSDRRESYSYSSDTLSNSWHLQPVHFFTFRTSISIFHTDLILCASHDPAGCPANAALRRPSGRRVSGWWIAEPSPLLEAWPATHHGTIKLK